MKKYINTLLLLVSILMQFFLVAQITSKTTKGGQTVGSEIVTFQSKINNTNYKLFVSLPEGYDDKKNKDKVYTFFLRLMDNGI